MISSHELRQLFVNYFQKRAHTPIPSASLIPSQEDHSLLFINAGMVPFKKIFAGIEPAEHTNLVSIQRCLRAGGKHNDLENVGYTTRHHTFFEMLGNFSFGGYSKHQAIQLAFEFLTQVLRLPKDKLWVTVYEEDQETADIWIKDLEFDKARLTYCGPKDNFWMMGDTGPCGPCTEIFYDRGPTVQGGPPGSPEEGGDRYVEIWNIVFMQYDRQADGKQLVLPKLGIDTGAGLERLLSVLQGVTSNYETDLFQPLIKQAIQLLPHAISRCSPTLMVIADHIRAIAFLLAEGILPSNEKRGYVLRRIIRRALRHGYQAGSHQPFLHKLLPTLINKMGDSYPFLRMAESSMKHALFQEEEQFLRTLHHGIQYFEKAVHALPEKRLPGDLVFQLYDTYGFPVDLTADLAREYGYSWDEVGFQQAMQQQKDRSKASHHFSNESMKALGVASVFNGYQHLTHTSQVIALLDQAYQPVTELLNGERGAVILEETPFYAEAGGQVGDQGSLWTESTPNTSHFIVLDTQKKNTNYLHEGYIKHGKIQVGDTVYSQVDPKRRQGLSQHHSATHLLHAALREYFGEVVQQKGSLVMPDYLRFDFQYADTLTVNDIQAIEYWVNQKIWENLTIQTQIMSLEGAKQSGAIALFDEKYAKSVRVLQIGEVSTELCGGTHASRSGDLGYFKITLSTSIAAQVKRIEAVVGEAAFRWVSQIETTQHRLGALLKAPFDLLVSKVEKQLSIHKQQTQEIAQLQQYASYHCARQLVGQGQSIKNLMLINKALPNILANQPRLIIDELKKLLPDPYCVILGAQITDRLSISISVSQSYTHLMNAKSMVDALSKIISGKGGGRKDFAHMTIPLNTVNSLSSVLATIQQWVIQHIHSVDV